MSNAQGKSTRGNGSGAMIQGLIRILRLSRQQQMLAGFGASESLASPSAASSIGGVLDVLAIIQEKFPSGGSDAELTAFLKQHFGKMPDHPGIIEIVFFTSGAFTH